MKNKKKDILGKKYSIKIPMSYKHDRFWEPQEQNTASLFGLCVYAQMCIQKLKVGVGEMRDTGMVTYEIQNKVETKS